MVMAELEGATGTFWVEFRDTSRHHTKPIGEPLPQKEDI